MTIIKNREASQMSEGFNLQEAKNRLVAKDNRLIQNSRYSLSVTENKAILYLISKIQPDDEPGKLYVFNCREFRNLIKWSNDSPYVKIKEMLTTLANMNWWVNLDSGKESLVRWFHVVRMDPGTEDIEIKFHEDMFPFLLQLNQRLESGHYFSTYRLQNITLFKHKYSIKLYELLKSYQFNNQRWTFENATGSQYDLQQIIGDVVTEEGPDKGKTLIPAAWANWALFKRDVLEPTVKEINAYTDIKVAYVGKKEDLFHKRTRAIRSIEFFLLKKTDAEQKKTDELIDREYQSIEDSTRYHQRTLDEYSVEEEFFRAHALSEEADREEKRRTEKAQLEDNSEHPMLFSELNTQRDANLSEKNICQLYNAAIRDRAAGNIDHKNWDLFAVDLVMHYFDIIEATPEETKTTLFRRLLDCVRHDYDEVTIELIRKYHN